MINPRTGKELHKNKRIVFMYKLTPQDADGVRNAYGNKYEIIDTSDCLEDLIAISAAIVFINPIELTEKQFALLEEYFRYEEIASLVFSSDPNKAWDFIYYVDEDLANATITWENEYDKDALDDKYIEVVETKENFLKKIDQLICEPEKYKSTMDRIVMTEKNCLLYEYINRILRHLNTLNDNGRVQFRQNIHCCLDEVLEKYGIN